MCGIISSLMTQRKLSKIIITITQKFNVALIATLSNIKVESGQELNPHISAIAQFVRACALIATTSLLGAEQINVFK